MVRLIFCLCILCTGLCFAQDRDPCTVQKLSGRDAYAILEKIAAVVPFDPQSFFLYESQAQVVKGRAVSRMCNGSERWILYDPEYVESIRQKDGNSNVPFYFVLAHEAAHHILGHTLLDEHDWDVGYWGPMQEEAADRSAAIWVTRALHVNRDDLLKAFDSLGLPEQANQRAGYPSRAARRTTVIQGYEEALAGNAPPSNSPNAPPVATSLTRPPLDFKKELEELFGKATPSTDPFRDAFERRIEEIRTSGKATTPLPGALRCSYLLAADSCTLSTSTNLSDSESRFDDTVGKVKSALPGQGWINDNSLSKASLASVFAYREVRFDNATMRVRVSVQLWKLATYEIDVVVGRIAAPPADPFRDALQHRIEEVRTSGKATTPMPGSIQCLNNTEAGDRCTLFNSTNVSDSESRFEDTIAKVKSALPGQGWINDNSRGKAGLTSFLAYREVLFNNATIGVRVRAQLWRVATGYHVDVVVQRIAVPADDAFRNALQRRVDEVRTSGKAITPMPGSIQCLNNTITGDSCVLFSSNSVSDSESRFEETIGRVKSALSGQEWIIKDFSGGSTIFAGVPYRETLLNNATIGVRVRVQLWRLTTALEVDIVVQRMDMLRRN
jgi:hypothetical protein